MSIPPPQPNGHQLWWYYPSEPGNEAFLAIFAILSALHLIGMLCQRMWFCVPMVIGGILEVVGYVFRTLSHSSPNSTGLFIGQTLLILLAPILYAASVYMYLGRVMNATTTMHLSPFPGRSLTRVFVTGDVSCLLIQAIGGGMTAMNKKPAMAQAGRYVILGGLGLQILFFALFVTTAAIVQTRMARMMMPHSGFAWQRSLITLYVISSLICLRNIYRLVEYGLGEEGYFMTHEWPGFVFDGMPMVFVMLISLIWYVDKGMKFTRARASRGDEEPKQVNSSDEESRGAMCQSSN